jgi:uncharacterized protein
MLRRVLFSLAAGLGLSASAMGAVPIAFDTFDSTVDLISFTQNPLGYTNAGDAFQVFQRGVSATVPFQLLDDTISIFPADTAGIISETKSDRWFGVTDTINPENPSNAVNVAEWVFAVSGATGLSVSVDMGAMGDFEVGADLFDWTYSLDGGAFLPLFTSSVNEAGNFTYTLDNAAQFTLDDPLLINGTVVSNRLTTFTAPVAGTGSQLTIRLSATTDGGTEGYVFDNVTVATSAPEPGTFALLAIGIGGVIARRRFLR